MPKTSIKGYKRNSPDKDEPELLIPSNKISMKNVPHKVLGIDNFGYSQIMEPNFDYEFPGDYVIEKPIKRKLQKGGDKNKKPSERKPIITNNPNDPRLRAYQDSLTLHNFGLKGERFFNTNIQPLLRAGKEVPSDKADLDEKATRLWHGKNKNSFFSRTEPAIIPEWDRLTKLNKKSPIPEKKVSSQYDTAFGYNKYKKPVQPVVYQKPKPKVSEDSLYNNFKNTLPSNLKNTSENDYNLRGYWESLGKPDKFDYTQPKEKDGYYHAFSRNPQTGEILKKPNHPTFQMALEEDAKIGYNAYQSPDGKIYTFGKNDTIPKGFTKYTTTKPTQQPTKPLPFKAKYNMPDTSATPNMQGEYPLRTFYQGTNTQREADSIEDVKGLERIEGYDITPTENKKVTPKPTQDKTDFYIQSLDKDGKQKVKYFNSKKEKDDYDEKLSKDFYFTSKTDNSTQYTAVLPEMQNGGELPLPPIGSKAYYDALKAKENKKSDNTIISKKPRKLSEAELKEYERFREKQEKNRFAKNSNYTREELTTREKRTPESDEHRRKQNQKYANSHGGYVNENGDYVQGLVNDAADTKIANRIYDNIVEPLINAEMVISGVGALGKGALKVAAEAEAKQLLKQAGKTVDNTILKNKTNSEIDWGKEYFEKVSAKEKELRKLAGSKKITNEEYLSKLELYKKELQKELGVGEEIGHGAYGSVYTSVKDPNKVIKIGSPMSEGQSDALEWTPEIIENLKSVRQSGNIAIPEKAQYFDIPSLDVGYKASRKEVIEMPNLNTIASENLNLNKRDRYALFLKQARQLRDKGIKLDVENPYNFKFNKDKGVFDIYDVNPHNIENPVNYMQYIKNKTRGPLYEDVTYKYGGTMNKLGVENSLWNNTRAKAGSGKKPSKEMLEQERKISKKQMGGEPEFDANNPLKYSYETLIQPGLNTPMSFRDMNMGNSYNPQDKPAPLPKPDFRVKPLQLQDKKKKEQQEQFGLSHIPILATNILAKIFSNSMNNREIERNNQRVNAFQSSPTYTPQGAAQYGDYTHDLSAYRPMAQLGGQYSQGFGMETVAPQINMPNQSYAPQPVQEQYVEENTVSNVPAIEFIKQLEGFEKKAKWDYAQNSVGYGTKAKYKGEVIDEAEAENRLEQEVVEVDNVISKKLKVPIHPNEKTTLLSLGYNLGPHSPIVAKVIQKLNNNEDRNEIAKYIEKSGLTRVGSKKILKGLVNRRKKEANMLLGNFQEGGEYEMSEDEIEEFILQGGQLKYLD